jgi:hypothetical protein
VRASTTTTYDAVPAKRTIAEKILKTEETWPGRCRQSCKNHIRQAVLSTKLECCACPGQGVTVRCPHRCRRMLSAASFGRGGVCIKNVASKPMRAFVATQMCAGAEMLPCSFLSLFLFKNHALGGDPDER